MFRKNEQNTKRRSELVHNIGSQKNDDDLNKARIDVEVQLNPVKRDVYKVFSSIVDSGEFDYKDGYEKLLSEKQQSIGIVQK